MADISVTYKNNTIAELNESGTKTLNTKGTYCEDNITIQYEKEAQNFKRWDITVSNSVPSSGAYRAVIENDAWLKENRTNPNLCVSIVPKFTIQGDGHIQGVFFNTNKVLIKDHNGKSYYSLSAYKHNTAGFAARMRNYSLTNAADVGDLAINANGTLSIVVTAGYPMAVGDYVVIAFIA